MRRVILFTMLCLPIVEFPCSAAEARAPQTVRYSEEGENADQTSLDVYPLSTGKDHPVMVWIHGGGWKFGDKARVLDKPGTFHEKGFAFVSINYRLQPGVDYKDQGGDVARAIHWVRDHAQEFGGSPDKIFLMGHSAGAHLAALVATDHRYLEAEGLNLDAIRGVVLLDGAAYDIPRQIEIVPLPRMKDLYLSAFTEDAAKQKDASPITHVAKEKNIPPFLILYVAKRLDGMQQSRSLAKALDEAQVEVEVIPAENKTHATISGEFGNPGDVPTRQVFEFLSSLLKAAK